jgi:hypothetical protein
MLSILIDPSSQFQRGQPIPVAPLAKPTAVNRHLHPLDLEIIQALEEAEEPVGVWQMLNAIAKSGHPATRAQARALRQEALARINPLVRWGLVRRIGRTGLALPNKPHESRHSLAGEHAGKVYAKSRLVPGPGGARHSAGSAGFVLL